MTTHDLLFSVLGESVGEAAQQSKDQRQEVMVYTFYYSLMKLIWAEIFS